jgi:hypothetical protein
METNCHYIRAWNRERLYEMADFKDKVVLDVGAGSGRLTFAAATLAKEVYASEPVEAIPMWYALNYGMCPARIWLDWRNEAVDGYYMEKVLERKG